MTVVPVLRCPLCGHYPCEIQKVSDQDPDSSLAINIHIESQTIHARCVACSAEFQVTTIRDQKNHS